MDVRSTPPGARVFIDGHFAGVAPFGASGLSSGEHYVTGSLEGYKLAQQRARPGTVELTLQEAAGAPNLRAARAQAAQEPDGPGRDRAAVAFGKAVGAEQVLLLEVRRGVSSQQIELVAIRLEVRDGHNAAYGASAVAVDASFPAGADALFAALCAQDEPRRGGPITHYPGSPTRKKVGIGLMVGGGALAVAGAVFTLLAINQQNSFRSLNQTDPNAPGVASTGRTYAAVADVGVIAGLALAGTGAIVAFTGGGSASSSSSGREVPMPAPPPGTSPARGPAKEEPRRRDDEKRKRDEEKRAKEHESDAKKQREEDERNRRDADVQRKRDESDAKKQREEDEHKKRDADAQRKRDESDAKKQREEDERKKRDADAQRKKDDEAAKRQREADERQARTADEQRKREEDAKKKRDEEQKKKKEQDQQKPPPKKDDDDLRNF
jgi:hypothetical protein